MNIKRYHNLKKIFYQNGGNINKIKEINNFTFVDLKMYEINNNEFKKNFDLSKRTDFKFEVQHETVNDDVIYSIIVNDVIIFSQIKELHEGIYGTVYLMKNNNDEHLVLKVGNNKKDIENLKILKKKNVCSDYYINSFYDKHEKYVIMEYADGTIKDLIKNNKFTIISLAYIFKMIFIMIKCLSDNKLYYTDLKLENILYRYENDNIKIILGDLGSIFKENDVDAISTYPYPYRCHNVDNCGIFKNPNEGDVLWSLGILCFDLFGIEKKYFNYQLIKKMYEQQNLKIPVINVFDTIPNFETTINISDIEGVNLKQNANRKIVKNTYIHIKNYLIEEFVKKYDNEKNKNYHNLIMEIKNLLQMLNYNMDFNEIYNLIFS